MIETRIDTVTFWARYLFVWGPVYYSMFCSIPGVYPPDASSTSQPKMSPDVNKSLHGEQNELWLRTGDIDKDSVCLLGNRNSR
jgi:hypothetical protein